MQADDYESVTADLVAYWRVLRQGGVLIGDVFDQTWPEVVRAVQEFAERLRQQVSASFPSKFLIEKNNSDPAET